MNYSQVKKTNFSKTKIIIRKLRTEAGKQADHRIHTNDGHEIYLLIKGDVSFSIDGNVYKVEPNDILLISNREIHRTIVNNSIPHERMYIYFDPEYLEQFSYDDYDLMKMFENRRLGFGNKIDKDIVNEYHLKAYLEQIYSWYHSDAPEKEIMMASILLQLLVKINSVCDVEKLDELEEGKVSSNINYNAKVYQIIRYISSNLDRRISLEELEKEFYINKYHLCHLFKNVTGFTVMEYVNYKKVLAAREKLKKGTAISDVWINFGFEDYSSFYRTFKKVSGTSPKEYLLKSTKKNNQRSGEPK